MSKKKNELVGYAKQEELRLRRLVREMGRERRVRPFLAPPEVKAFDIVYSVLLKSLESYQNAPL